MGASVVMRDVCAVGGLEYKILVALEENSSCFVYSCTNSL